MNIIYIGANGFPFGMATIQRQLLIAKGFVLQENSCLVLTKFGLLDKQEKLKRKGKIEGVPYLCASPVPYRPSNFIFRTLNKTLGSVLETFYIVKNRKRNTKNILFSVRTSFISTVYYRLLSFLLGYKYVADINEALGDNIDASLNDKLFDKYNKHLYDGVLLISDKLMDNYENNIPKLKIPVICDISKLDEIKKITLDDFNLLYCASASYLETLKFVIEVFEKTILDTNLILIVSGSESQMKQVKQLINHSKKNNNIILKSRIEYSELIGLYKGADLLLIPLPEIEQHKARFPHKIAEYTACKTPFVSNRWGEVINYFNNDNCFLADNYTIDKYVNILNGIIHKPKQNIADKAYEISKNHFDYKVLSTSIDSFLKKI
ncbi:glycosyltransferase [Maribacter sp. 1_MG-2023]|uniref:glycosyltransferase n=1 Tax=Maribacter sp. 1_MG-2023 TaxID=3062677 RepID=UPI0026E30D54|nr:glycosyltransferase [Maribacter sp. 1_MG-2023]MDO6470716.1 glycosyltransferase [Maribacter sp. 1_MG-2023]